MTRYFYTDPLAAAFMAKHHGFALQYVESYSGDSWLEDIDYERIMRIIGRYGTESYELSKLYVSPESQHLLEPRPRDFAVTPTGVAAAVESLPEIRSIGGIDRRVVLFGGYYEEVSRLASIVERGGRAFIWPEREAK